MKVVVICLLVFCLLGMGFPNYKDMDEMDVTVYKGTLKAIFVPLGSDLPSLDATDYEKIRKVKYKKVKIKIKDGVLLIKDNGTWEMKRIEKVSLIPDASKENLVEFYKRRD